MDYDYLIPIRHTGTNYESQNLQLNNAMEGEALTGDY